MIDGAMLIGGEARQAAARFDAINPATGETLAPSFSSATPAEAAEAAALAEAAFPTYATLEPEARAAFLEACAEAILAIGDELIERAIVSTPPIWP